MCVCVCGGGGSESSLVLSLVGDGGFSLLANSTFCLILCLLTCPPFVYSLALRPPFPASPHSFLSVVSVVVVIFFCCFFIFLQLLFFFFKIHRSFPAVAFMTNAMQKGVRPCDGQVGRMQPPPPPQSPLNQGADWLMSVCTLCRDQLRGSLLRYSEQPAELQTLLFFIWFFLFQGFAGCCFTAGRRAPLFALPTNPAQVLFMLVPDTCTTCSCFSFRRWAGVHIMLLDARQKLFIFAVPTRSAETVHCCAERFDVTKYQNIRGTKKNKGAVWRDKSQVYRRCHGEAQGLRQV